MSKINLNDDDKIRLIEAMNNGVEPSPDLLPKLFPGTAEKFDVVKLDRAKVPTLEYAGKRSKAAILAEASSGSGPLQIERSFGEVKEDEWKNLIIQGDNLQFLKTCYKDEDPLIKSKVKGKVKLIYIDPPFATESDFSGSEGEYSYSDKVANSEFIEGLKERLILLWELLEGEGSIFIHLDYRTIHYIKIICDEIFGKQNLVNEIIYGYRIQGISSSSYARKHQTILWYSKKPFYPKLEIERIWYEKSFRDTAFIEPNIVNDDVKQKIIEQINSGRPLDDKYKEVLFRKYYSDVRVRDVWDSDRTKPFISGAKEYLNYRTQKSEGLSHRIIENHSIPGDLIIDVFGGSGTTAAVAEKLGRRWISCDFGKHAIYTQQKRILRIEESKALVEEKDKNDKVVVKKGDPYGHKPKPFVVASVGAYDFSHVMSLRNHKDRYVDFVLGLFQLSKLAEKDLFDEKKNKTGKYKLTNIFAEKDKSPVEVYPVWQDEYLKDIRIDEDYLQAIIDQAGSKISGDYYIIAPETCSNIGDISLKNGSDEVLFHILSFPYKVLEDASRHFTLHDQPSSQDDVNQLITSTAFYFNDDVEIKTKRNTEGFEVVEFKTNILDKEGKPFSDLDGIAMILVDQDFDSKKSFDMDETIFAKDIKDGKVKIKLTDSVAIIAIDKHGNESKPVKI